MKTDLRLHGGNRQILAMALPIAGSLLVPQLNFITNNIFLGGLGQRELALAGITGVYYLLFASLGHGLHSGVQSLLSRRAGENRVASIGLLFHQGLWLSALMGLGGVLLTLLVAPLLLPAVMANKADAQLAVEFLQWRILGLPLLYAYQAHNALLVGTRRSHLMVIGTASETACNVLLDYALIYGHLGLPALGFKGAAVASVLAEAFGLAVAISVVRLCGLRAWLRQQQHTVVHLLWRSDDGIAAILRQSVPLILQFSVSLASWEYFYVLIEHQGQQALAVSNTMRNIFGFVGCLTWAFASTTNTMVSNLIGQGRADEVLSLTLRIALWNLLLTGTVCLLLNLAPHGVLSIYGQGEAFVIAATPVLRVVTVAMSLMAVTVVWMNAVTGTGNTRVNLYTELAAISAYCIHVWVVLELWHMPVAWGWAGEWLYWIILLTPSYLYMRSGRWMRRIALEPAP
jgi:putative MATE family efflux protein